MDQPETGVGHGSGARYVRPENLPAPEYETPEQEERRLAAEKAENQRRLDYLYGASNSRYAQLPPHLQRPAVEAGSGDRRVLASSRRGDFTPLPEHSDEQTPGKECERDL